METPRLDILSKFFHAFSFDFGFDFFSQSLLNRFFRFGRWAIGNNCLSGCCFGKGFFSGFLFFGFLGGSGGFRDSSKLARSVKCSGGYCS